MIIYKLILILFVVLLPSAVTANDSVLNYRILSYVQMIDSLNWSYKDKASHIAWAADTYKISAAQLANATKYTESDIVAYLSYGKSVQPIRHISTLEDKGLVTKVNELNTYDVTTLQLSGNWLNRIDKVFIGSEEQVIASRSSHRLDIAITAKTCGPIYVQFFDSTIRQRVGFYGITSKCKAIISAPKLRQVFEQPLLEGKSIGISFNTSIPASTKLQLLKDGRLIYQTSSLGNYIRVPGEYVTANISIILSTNDSWESGIPHNITITPNISEFKQNLELFVVSLRTSDGLEGKVPPLEELRYAIIKAFPIYDNINIVQVPNPFVVDFKMLDQDDWSKALSKLLIDRRKYLSNSGNYNSILYAFSPYRGSSIAGIAFINSVVALGIDSASSWEKVFIHEVGHTLSLQHAPCGITYNSDSLYPYERGTLGTNTPFDILEGKISNKAYDVMGYCGGKWFSDYNYNKLIDNVKSRFSPQQKILAQQEHTLGIVMQLKSGRASFLATASKLSGGELVSVSLDDGPYTEGILYTIDHSQESLIWIPAKPSTRLLIRGTIYEVQADTP